MDAKALSLYALAVLQAYFLGAIPFGFLLVKVIKGIDVRAVGSGNIGATNVARVAGIPIGIVSFVLDVAKGFLAATWIPFAMWALAGGAYTITHWSDILRDAVAAPGFADLRIACALAAIIGHIWTVFLKFKGGKGVATSLGALLGLTPWATLVAFAVWIAATVAFRYISLASIAAAVALPVAFAFINRAHISEKWHLLVLAILVAAIVIIRHRTNIRRLLSGTEYRLSFRRRQKT